MNPHEKVIKLAIAANTNLKNEQLICENFKILFFSIDNFQFFIII